VDRYSNERRSGIEKEIDIKSPIQQVESIADIVGDSVLAKNFSGCYP
jgi:hypothetical protein